MGTVANLAIRVGVNAQDVTKGIADIGTEVSGLGSRLSMIGAAVAGAFSVNAIAGAAGQAVESASRIADMAERVGISAEAVQRLQFAAEQSGGSFEAIATSMRVMSDRIVDGKLPDALTAMGLSLDQLRTMSPDQAFITIADAIARIPDPMQQTATAVDVFGRGAQQLLPAIKSGFTEIAETAPVMSNAVIAAADQTGDKWAEMSLRISNLQAEALLPLVNLFTSLPESLQIATAGIASFLPSLTEIGIAIIAAGGPKAAFGMLIEAGTAVGGFFSTTLPGLFAGGLTFLTTTLPAAFTSVIAFLGPQGLIAVALIALAAIWLKWGDDIKAIAMAVYTSVKTWLVDKWADIKTQMTTALSGWSLAFTTAKTAIVAVAQGIYEGIKSWIVDKLTAVFNAVKAPIEQVKSWFKGMYQAVVGGSFVPDMVKGIGQWFGQLGGLMVGPAQSATSSVAGFFSSMASSAIGSVRGLIDTLSSSLTGWLSGFMPKWAADFVGGLSQNIMGGLANRFLGGGGGLGGFMGGGGKGGGFPGMGGGWGDLVGLGVAGVGMMVDHFRGGEEGIRVNPERDAFLSQFGDRGTGIGSGFLELARRLTEITGQEGGGQSFRLLMQADTMEKFAAATRAIEAILDRGGGFNAAPGTPGAAAAAPVNNVTVNINAQYVGADPNWFRDVVCPMVLDAIGAGGSNFATFDHLVDQAMPMVNIATDPAIP